MNCACKSALAFGVAAFAIGPAHAHDIWLQADAYRLARGEPLIVRQRVGEELTAADEAEGTQELPVLRDMTPHYFLATAEGEIDLLAELPDLGEQPIVKPVLERTVDESGSLLVAMEHDVLYTDHTNDEFLEYLEHEGLPVDEYRPAMSAEDYQSEGYRRSLKTLVRVGDATDASEVASRVLGQVIEIVLLDDPYDLDAGDDLAARVMLRGEPLAGQRVKAYIAGEGGIVRRAATTDDDGIARFPVVEPGLWLLRSVHLSPCTETSAIDCSDAHWESYWSAFTFELD